ncbi:hypothetical protein K803_08584, partial [Salmonella enterica subsp. enterica serovar Newport str. SHSN013]
MVVLPWRASEGAEEKSVMMTGWRDCHFTAKKKRQKKKKKKKKNAVS